MTSNLDATYPVNQNDDDVLISVKGVSKKFCRSLKRSLWYGLQDISSEFLGKSKQHESLRKDEFWAIKDVSFEVRRGECLGLIGPNGAGKSTLLKLLTGIIKPDMGEIRIKGRVGALIELGAGFHPILTGRENIYINGTILGLTKKEINEKFEQIIDFADIGDFLDTPVQNYSSGMRVRLGFAIAANLEPDILFIDEVLAVGDTGFRMKCFEHLIKLTAKGTSLIMVTHNIFELYRVSRRSIVLHHGKNEFDGSLDVAIGHYHHLMIKKTGTDRASVKSQFPWLESVTFFDANGKMTNKFATGDNIYADIAIKTEKTIDNARLIVFIESGLLGTLGSFSTPYKNFCFSLKPPLTTIRLLLANIPLLVGGYSIRVDLYGEKITDFYDRKAPAAYFQIVAPSIDTLGFGVCDTFNFEHFWSLI